MAEQNTNTTETLTKPKVNDTELQQQIKNAAKRLEGEKMAEVSVNKNFQKNIGHSLPLGINGAVIVLPVDGKKRKVPKSYADLLEDYLAGITT